MKILAGFKFKPTHDDIHFLCVNQQSKQNHFSCIDHGNDEYEVLPSDVSEASKRLFSLSGYPKY